MESINYLEKLIIYVVVVLYLIMSAQGIRAFFWYWFDSLALVTSVDKTRYSRLKMAHPRIRQKWRELMVRQAQELKADHIGFWMLHLKKGEMYVSMLGEYSDNKKIQSLRSYGQRYKVSNIPDLMAAANAGAPFVYSPAAYADQAGDRKMDAVSFDFFTSSLIIPYKKRGKLYFILAASWIGRDISEAHASGSLAPQLREVGRINDNIHTLLKHLDS
jgi:hypothetical protein